MKPHLAKAMMALLSSLLLTGIACAEPTNTIDFSAGAGYQHDSNVGIAAIDNNSGEADSAWLLNAGIAGNWHIRRSSSLRLAYDFSDTAYEHASEFDLAMHHASLEFAHRLHGLDTSLSADAYSARLDGNRYLSMTRLSPGLAYLFGSRLYLRGAWSLADKEYHSLPDRNATTDGLRVDAYWLFDGMQRYLAVGAEQSQENARALEFDFTSTTGSITYGQRFDLALMTLKLRAQVRREDRNYGHTNASIDAPRRDRRLRTSLTALIPLGEVLELEGQVARFNNDSNLPSAAADRTSYTVRLTASF